MSSPGGPRDQTRGPRLSKPGSGSHRPRGQPERPRRESPRGPVLAKPEGPLFYHPTRGRRLSIPGSGSRSPRGQPEGPWSGAARGAAPPGPEGAAIILGILRPRGPLPFNGPLGSLGSQSDSSSRSRSLEEHVWDRIARGACLGQDRSRSMSGTGLDRKAIVAQGAGARGALCSRSGLDKTRSQGDSCSGSRCSRSVLEERAKSQDR